MTIKNFWELEGTVHKVKKIEKKAGGYFTTFSLSVSMGKDKDTDKWRPSGWCNVKVFGDLGNDLNLTDKQRVIASGYHVWDEGKGEDRQYRGWQYIATSVEVVGQSASQRKANEEESAPF